MVPLGWVLDPPGLVVTAPPFVRAGVADDEAADVVDVVGCDVEELRRFVVGVLPDEGLVVADDAAGVEDTVADDLRPPFDVEAGVLLEDVVVDLVFDVLDDVDAGCDVEVLLRRVVVCGVEDVVADDLLDEVEADEDVVAAGFDAVGCEVVAELRRVLVFCEDEDEVEDEVVADCLVGVCDVLVGFATEVLVVVLPDVLLFCPTAGTAISSTALMAIAVSKVLFIIVGFFINLFKLRAINYSA